MLRSRRFLLVLILATVSAGSALAGEHAAKDPKRLRYSEQTSGGNGGTPRSIERSWYRPDGARVSETLTYGVKSVKFKGAQHATNVNTGRATLARSVDAAHLQTRVHRVFVGKDRGTRTTKSWKTNRFDISLSVSTTQSEPARWLSIVDRVTRSSFSVTERDGARRPETEAYKQNGADDALIETMAAKAAAIMKSRARPHRRAAAAD